MRLVRRGYCFTCKHAEKDNDLSISYTDVGDDINGRASDRLSDPIGFRGDLCVCVGAAPYGSGHSPCEYYVSEKEYTPWQCQCTCALGVNGAFKA